MAEEENKQTTTPPLNISTQQELEDKVGEEKVELLRQTQTQLQEFIAGNSPGSRFDDQILEPNLSASRRHLGKIEANCKQLGVSVDDLLRSPEISDPQGLVSDTMRNAAVKDLHAAATRVAFGEVRDKSLKPEHTSDLFSDVDQLLVYGREFNPPVTLHDINKPERGALDPEKVLEDFRSNSISPRFRAEALKRNRENVSGILSYAEGDPIRLIQYAEGHARVLTENFNKMEMVPKMELKEKLPEYNPPVMMMASALEGEDLAEVRNQAGKLAAAGAGRGHEYTKSTTPPDGRQKGSRGEGRT